MNVTQTKALPFDEPPTPQTPVTVIGEDPVSVEVEDLNLFYDGVQALKDIKLKIAERQVTAFIGPSGCGKSTLLRCFNRMNDLIESCSTDGRILMNGQDILARNIDVAELRRQVGMVFQKPNPFPKSIYENVAYGLRIQGLNKRRLLDETVEVLVEGKAKDKWQGRTRSDRLVFFQNNHFCQGQILNIRIEKTSPWSLQGKII
jgi:phosphate transport system ATP-binding protein